MSHIRKVTCVETSPGVPCFVSQFPVWLHKSFRWRRPSGTELTKGRKGGTVPLH